MNGKPTEKQKKFHAWAREHGCIVSSMNCDAIHHIKGAKMKLKGVDNAGEWFILPLSYWWHQDGSNDAAIHVNKKRFTLSQVQSEKGFWIELIRAYENEFGVKPMSEEEYQIIAERG